ncbi:MAG: FxsA family protein [Gammaproteobacteria bacterium]|nr:FxsA family protein [Gammaproteobacteria bacterium]MDH5803239.1 FxsA family protein [Gammaproteobacteria bacterium]
MHPFTILLILFLSVPLVEIYLLIEVGGWIGVFPTIFLVVFTAVLGAWLLRWQGFSTLRRIQETTAQGGIPAVELVEGAVLIVSGALLLTPGFFTDAIGFMCLVPRLRQGAIKWALKRFFHGGSGEPTPFAGAQPRSSHRSKTIEGEYKRED